MIFPDIEDKDLAMVCLLILGTFIIVYYGKDGKDLLELIIVGILALAGDSLKRVVKAVK